MAIDCCQRDHQYRPNIVEGYPTLSLYLYFRYIFEYYCGVYMCNVVITLLFGDINNSYLRIFFPVVSFPTVTEKSKILLIWMFFFISLNRTRERWRDTELYYILLFLSAPAKNPGTCGPPAITTTSQHVRRQQPLLSKTYLYLFRKSGIKFPAGWRNMNFSSGRKSKIHWYKKINQFDLSGAWTQN